MQPVGFRFIAQTRIILNVIFIMILDITFYLKHNVSETGFCLRLQVERTQFGHNR
jgi:hypothetical protein